MGPFATGLQDPHVTKYFRTALMLNERFIFRNSAAIFLARNSFARATPSQTSECLTDVVMSYDLQHNRHHKFATVISVLTRWTIEISAAISRTIQILARDLLTLSL
jgi:hypothetical protein